MGPATARADGTVSRVLERVVTGTPPVAGQPAALDSAYWLGDPAETMGLEYTEVTVGAGLPAWFFPAERSPGAAEATAPAPTPAVAIVVHGQNGSRVDGLRAVDTMLGLEDLAVLDITYRNDVGAPSDPSGRLQYGVTEWQDLDAAVTWAREQGAREVVLFGQSMGGAIVAPFMANSGQADVVSRVVLDAPMLSLAASVENGARTAMPVTGGGVPAPIVWAAEQLAALRFGIDWAAVDYLDDTSWVQVPTLVLHGTADPRVPVELAEELAAAEPELVTLETVPDALHVETWNFGPADWKDTVRSFLETTS